MIEVLLLTNPVCYHIPRCNLPNSLIALSPCNSFSIVMEGKFARVDICAHPFNYSIVFFLRPTPADLLHHEVFSSFDKGKVKLLSV